jgi:hypothetical protein
MYTNSIAAQFKVQLNQANVTPPIDGERWFQFIPFNPGAFMFKLNTRCDDIEAETVKSIAIDDAHCITLWSNVVATFSFGDFSVEGAPEPLMLNPNVPVSLGPPPIGSFEPLTLYYQSAGDEGNISVVWW